jgi:uncharacterized membrane protein (UPF0127 family)
MLALLIAASCHTEAAVPPAPSKLPLGAVRFDTPRGPWIVKVEIASTDEQKQRGLMYRRELPQDTGMLFLFDRSSEHGFWMHNTELSLDMIFLDEDRAVVGVVDHARPHDDTPRSVKKPSRYVLEVLAGEASAHAVGPGSRATFIDVPE